MQRRLQRALLQRGLRQNPRLAQAHAASRRLYSSTAQAETEAESQGPSLIRFTDPTAPNQKTWKIVKNNNPTRKLFKSRRNDLFIVAPWGELLKLDPAFLRDSCECTQCVDEHSGNKKFYTAEIPENIGASNVRFLGGDSPAARLQVEWYSDIPGYGSDHITTLPLASLIKSKSVYTKQLGHNKETKPHIPGPWKSEKLEDIIKTYDFEEYVNRGEKFRDAIFHLSRFGLIFVKNVPESEKSVEQVAEQIGPLKNTFYGYTWDVKDKPKAENVAYTSGYLGLHMDLLYMKQPPGLQLLHCIRSSEQGGESIFSDSFSAAKTMRNQVPELFDALSEFQVPYHYRKGGHYYYDMKPTFDVGSNLGLRYSPRKFGEPEPVLQNVNWSPPFQGQFDYRAVRDMSKFNEYVHAAGVFHNLVNQPESIYERRLQPGEVAIFNNRRILHGRKAFTSAGERWYKGAYIDSDPFDSLTRSLQINPGPEVKQDSQNIEEE